MTAHTGNPKHWARLPESLSATSGVWLWWRAPRERKPPRDANAVISPSHSATRCCVGGLPGQAEWSAAEVDVGSLVDCQDTMGKWCVAQIVHQAADGMSVTVRYKGWGSRWDEVLPVGSHRLAPPGSMNPAEGPRRARQGEDWAIEEKEIMEYVPG